MGETKADDVSCQVGWLFFLPALPFALTYTPFVSEKLQVLLEWEMREGDYLVCS